jgi:hypothetical protein
MTNVDVKVPFEVTAMGSGLVINVPAGVTPSLKYNAAVAVPG